MPLLYEIELQIKKRDVLPKEEKYSQEEINELKRWIEDKLDSAIYSHEFGPASPLFKEKLLSYDSDPTKVEFVAPLRSLSDLVVPLAELRTEIARLMAEGITSLSLENMLLVIRTTYRNSKA